MYDYKFEIYKKFSNLSDGEELDIDKIVDTFYECEANLPLEGYFEKYNDIFSNFVSEIDYLNRKKLFDINNMLLRFTPIELWNKFCLGLRVKKHDSFYQSSVAGWDKEFKANLPPLEKEVLKISKIREKCGTTEKVVLNPNYTKILESSVGTYINR